MSNFTPEEQTFIEREYRFMRVLLEDQPEQKRAAYEKRLRRLGETIRGYLFTDYLSNRRD